MLKCHQLSPDTLDNQAAAETYPIFCFTWSISHLVWPEERNLEWIWSCFLFYTRTTTKTTMIHPMTKNCCGILSPHRNEARQGDDAHKRKQPRRGLERLLAFCRYILGLRTKFHIYFDRKKADQISLVWQEHLAVLFNNVENWKLC